MGCNNGRAEYRDRPVFWAWPVTFLVLLASLAGGQCQAQPGARPASPPSGCDACSLAGPAVVGADGLLYPNECVALCQGVDVASSNTATTLAAGADSTGAPQAFQALDDSMHQLDGSVSWDDMQALEHEGYRFVGTALPHQGGPGNAGDVLANIDWARTDGASSGWGVTITFPNHHVYVQTRPPTTQPQAACTFGCDVALRPPLSPSEAPPATPPSPSSPRAPSQPMVPDAPGEPDSPDTPPEPPPPPPPPPPLAARRALRAVLGRDTRYPAMARVFPNTASFQIRFQAANGQYSRCSASLISPSVLLTNGHCVYNGEPGQPRSYFSAPSYRFYTRFAGDSAALELDVRPVRIVTTRGWIKDRNQADDIAVIYLDARLDDVYAVMPVGYDCKQTSYPEVSVLGFPGGLPLGSRMKSNCAMDQMRCDGSLVRHDCDTSPGQSGSPIFTPDNIVRAVHACTDGRTNCGARLRPAVFGIIATAFEATSAP